MNQKKGATVSPISFSRILAHWSEIQPNSAAIVHDGESISWTALEHKTNQLARAYEDMGVKENDFVTVALPNGIEFIAACFAIWKLGATPQPVSYRLPKIGIDAIIELAHRVLSSVQEWRKYAFNPEGFAGYEDFSTEALQKKRQEFKSGNLSGSTGRPKLIVMPRLQCGIWISPISLFPINPLCWCRVRFTTRAVYVGNVRNMPGNTTVIVTRFDAEETQN